MPSIHNRVHMKDMGPYSGAGHRGQVHVLNRMPVHRRSQGHRYYGLRDTSSANRVPFTVRKKYQFVPLWVHLLVTMSVLSRVHQLYPNCR